MRLTRSSSLMVAVQTEKVQQPDQWSKMDATVADYLIRKWQTIKARALGPNHTVAQLPEVTDALLIVFSSWRGRMVSAGVGLGAGGWEACVCLLVTRGLASR